VKRINTRALVLIALFAAISIVLTRFLVVYLSNSVRISFGMIPVILASLLLGPLAGAFTGGVADILGSVLFSPLGWYPPLTISPVLIGILPALLKPLILKKVSIARIALIILLSEFLTSMTVTTYLLSGLYGTPYLDLLAVRAPIAIAISAVETVLIFVLYKRLKKETL
jgi:riboflavin transporter